MDLLHFGVCNVIQFSSLFQGKSPLGKGWVHGSNGTKGLSFEETHWLFEMFKKFKNLGFCFGVLFW